MTTHIRAPGRMGETYAACGRHLTHLYADQLWRTKPRAQELKIAAASVAPNCSGCLRHFRTDPPTAADPPPLKRFNHSANARKLARAPGSSWRFQTGGSIEVHSDPPPVPPAARFDEVVDDWLHCEMMDKRSCFVRVAGLCLHLNLTRSGAVITEIEIRAEGDAARGIPELLRRAAGGGV